MQTRSKCRVTINLRLASTTRTGSTHGSWSVRLSWGRGPNVQCRRPRRVRDPRPSRPMRRLRLSRKRVLTTAASMNLKSVSKRTRSCAENRCLWHGTGQARGFAFVEMSGADGAQRAISELDKYGGQDLRVNEAKPITPRVNDRRWFWRRS